MSRVRSLQLAAFAVAAASALAFAGCGDEIGDSCKLSSDCSPDGDRLCDTSSLDGYCTVLGCDFESCPEESTCVKFYTGVFDNRPCDRADAGACNLDEVCTLEGFCAPRTNEIRFCMKTCGSDGDCRDGYECRTEAKMRENGGEPVLAPGSDAKLPKFCAQAPRSSSALVSEPDLVDPI
jgi:hypothetical protein